MLPTTLNRSTKMFSGTACGTVLGTDSGAGAGVETFGGAAVPVGSFGGGEMRSR